MEQNKIVVFESKKIRRIWYNEEWFFSVVDVCGALTTSVDPGAYWRKLKQRLIAEGSQVVTFCHDLKLEALDGKKYLTDCSAVKGLFRIIQSIPSPKAEPFLLSAYNNPL
jgi:prophage antirepressor-like protein